MTLTLKIDLLKIDALTFDESFNISFDSITEITGFNESWVETLTKLSLEIVSSTSQGDTSLFAYVTTQQSPITSYVVPDIHECSLNGYLIMTCNVSNSDLPSLIKLIKMDIVTLDINGNTSLIVYKQNAENDEMNKSLTFVNILVGKFNHSIAIKNINIDLIGYSESNTYNYVYIPSLKRYYYVDSCEIISGDYVRLHLREDVLMSWKPLIKRQKAFVTRIESSNNDALVDNRLPLENKLTIEYIYATNYSPQPSTLAINTFPENEETRIMVTVINDESYGGGGTPTPLPSLPAVSTDTKGAQEVYFMTASQFSSLIKALYRNDTYGSYVLSAIWLPFKPDSIYFQPSSATTKVKVNDKYLTDLGNFKSTDSQLVAPETWVMCHRSEWRCAPYLCVKAFQNTLDNKFYNREPYAQYDLLVPFVGWVKLQSNQLFGNKINVYYVLENTSGMATAYVYDVTHSKLIYSSTCQLGIKIDTSTTNLYENIKQKQSNDLNMIMGGLSTILSIGIGVATENPIAVVGGVMTGAKTIASYVNANRSIFERASTNFGSNAGSLYTTQDIMIRKVYNKPLTINTDTYKHIQGYPCNNYMADLSSLQGYVEIGEIHFNPMNEDIYQDEIQEIVSLLQQGVIF